MQLLRFYVTLKTSVPKKVFVRTLTVASEAVSDTYNNSLKSWKDIPGPSTLPVIGRRHHFLPGGLLHNLSGYEVPQKLYETYGPLVRLDAVIGERRKLYVFDPEVTSQILRSENVLPIRYGFESIKHFRKEVSKYRKPNTPTGLITEHGEPWREMRTATNQIFLQPKLITEQYSSAFEEVSTEMVERIKSLRGGNNSLKGNFIQEIHKWALETIGTLFFGCRLNSFNPNLSIHSPNYKLLAVVPKLLKSVHKMDLQPSLWSYIWTPAFAKSMQIYEEHETLSRHFIEQARQKIKMTKKPEGEKGILEKLFDINGDFANAFASDMMFAGIGTVANTFTGALYLLAKNPEKQEILRNALNSGDEKKRYLKACLKEALRMMPVVTGVRRITTKEHHLPEYTIPTGVMVEFHNRHMTMMETQYPMPKEFIPERWLADKEDPLSHKSANPFTYLPFGYGVRTCIGRRIAELQLEILTAQFVETFDVRWIGAPPNVLMSAINFVKGPLNFVFNDAPK